jgi:hypothetical protein
MTRLRLPSRPLALLAACAAVPALAACGGDSGGNPDADPAALAPARSPVYLEATLNPDGDLEEAVRELGRKLGGTEDVGAEIKRVIERETREDGDRDFSFDEDVEPWLGDRVGIFFHDISGTDEEPEGAVVFATKDPDKAREALEGDLASLDGGKKGEVVSRTYRDTDYKVERTEGDAVAILDDYAVFGDETGVKAAIDAREGEALADADAFKRARDQVPDDGLGFGYLGVRQLVSALGPQGAAVRPLLSSVGDSIAIALDAEKDAIRFDTASLGADAPPGAGPGKVLPELPGDSWAAFGTADVGGTVERALRQFGQLGALGGVDIEQQLREQLGIDVQRDVVSWMGDAGVFVTGSSLDSIGGGLVVEVKDRARAVAAVPKLARLAASAGELRVSPLRVDGVDAGFRLRSAAVPVPIDMGVTEDDRFVLAAGSGAFEAATSGSDRLGESQAFRDATEKLGDGFKTSFFVDLAPVRELISGLGLDDAGETERRVMKALEALTTVSAGGKREGEVSRGRLVIGVK